MLRLESGLVESPIQQYFFARRGSEATLNSTERRRRSRKRAILTESNTPKSTNSQSNMTFSDIKPDSSRAIERDRFLEVLEKPEKDDADGRAIYGKVSTNSFFQENTKLFQEEISSEGLNYLCKKMSLEFFREYENIYEKGEISGDKIYLVYKGELEAFNKREAWKPNQNKVINRSNFSNEHIKRMSYGSNEETSNSISQFKSRSSLISFQFNNQKVTEKEMTFSEKLAEIESPIPMNLTLPVPIAAATIRAGEYFGREILENKSEREQTIVAKMATYLLVLKKKDIEYAKKHYEKNNMQKLKWICRHLYGPQQSSAKNIILSNYFEKELHVGDVLLSEGQVGGFFYILYEGKCEVQKRALIRENERCGEMSASSRKSTKSITVCLTEKGAILGEEVLFKTISIYDYSVRVVGAKATFFQFRIADFQKSTDTVDKEMIRNLEQKYLKKEENRQTIFNNISKEFSKRCYKESLNLSSSPTSNDFFGSKLSENKNQPEPSLVPSLKKSRSIQNYYHNAIWSDEKEDIEEIPDQTSPYVISRKQSIQEQKMSSPRIKHVNLQDKNNYLLKEDRANPKGRKEFDWNCLENFRFDFGNIKDKTRRKKDLDNSKISFKLTNNSSNEATLPLAKRKKWIIKRTSSSPKIDLKELRKEFYDSPYASIKEYFATYKKAKIQNRFHQLDTSNSKKTKFFTEYLSKAKLNVESPSSSQEESNSTSAGELRKFGRKFFSQKGLKLLGPVKKLTH